MTRILLLLLATAGILRAATGDILSVSVNADGWSADVTVAGLSTGGTYVYGLGTNNNITSGTPKMVFSLTSEGYTDAGVLSTTSRTIYGTERLRKPYPNEAQAYETVSGGNVIIRMALSDRVYVDDTSITVTIGSGWYTQAATPNNSVTALAVTNNATEGYAKVVGAWNTVPFQRVTGNFKLRASAFHRDGKNGKPVAAVKFTVTDGTNTVTSTVTGMTISNDDTDAVDIPEYIATINVSTLTQGATLTCNFIAYPWVGDAATILDTSAGSAAPSPNAGPITMVNDKSGTYGVTMALVDSATGNDTTGTAYDSASFVEGTAAKFATIAKAAQKIKDYNTTNRSRGDVGAGVIYLASGNHAWMGASLGSVYGTTPNCYVTVKPAPSATRADVFITSASGNYNISSRMCLQDLTLTTTAANLFFSIGAMWLDGCKVDTTNASLFGPGVFWLTQCDVPRLNQGLRPLGAANTSFAMIRGCNLSGFSGTIHFYNMIGNLKSGVTAGTPNIVSSTSNSQTCPVPHSQILAYNKIYGFDAGSTGANTMFQALNHVEATHPQRGLALVQNLLERIGTSSYAGIDEMGSASGAGNTSNTLVWNNTFAGQRSLWFYNSEESVARYHKLPSIKNNILWDYNIKSDTHTDPNGPDGDRIGNWEPLYGVGYSGNVLADQNTGFYNEFSGLSSVEATWTSTGSTYFGYVDYRANDNVTAGTGNGDYTLTSGSPSYNLARDWLLPYDIDGNARGATDSAGAITTFAGSNTAPVATITSPANASSNASPVTITGTATDAEDGTITSSIVWTSSVNGAIGTGASISPSLSAGSHTITATITDAGGLTDTDTITITVTAPTTGASIQATTLRVQ